MPDAAEKPARPAFFIIFSMKKMEPLFSLSVLSFFLHPAFVFTVGRSEKSDAVKRFSFVK